MSPSSVKEGSQLYLVAPAEARRADSGNCGPRRSSPSIRTCGLGRRGFWTEVGLGGASGILSPVVPICTSMQALRGAWCLRTGHNLVGVRGCHRSSVQWVPGEPHLGQGWGWTCWAGETSAGGDGKCTAPSSKGVLGSREAGKAWQGSVSQGAPSQPSWGVGARKATASRLGHHGGKEAGSPLLGGQAAEAINWLHSSTNEMEMRPPDRGVIEWGKNGGFFPGLEGQPPPHHRLAHFAAPSKPTQQRVPEHPFAESRKAQQCFPGIPCHG